MSSKQMHMLDVRFAGDISKPVVNFLSSEVNNHSMGIVTIQSLDRIQGSIYLLDA